MQYSSLILEIVILHVLCIAGLMFVLLNWRRMLFTEMFAGYRFFVLFPFPFHFLLPGLKYAVQVFEPVSIKKTSSQNLLFKKRHTYS